MVIRFLCGWRCYNKGETCDLFEHIALRLVYNKIAEHVVEQPPVQEPVSIATTPKRKYTKRKKIDGRK